MKLNSLGRPNPCLGFVVFYLKQNFLLPFYGGAHRRSHLLLSQWHRSADRVPCFIAIISNPIFLDP